MKILQINSNVGIGSTGRIVEGIGLKILEQKGWKSIVAFGREGSKSKSEILKIGNVWDVYCHVVLTRLTDRNGIYSTRSTKKLLKKVIQFAPDIIHLHNVHAYYINYKLLFDFLNEYEIPVVWTFHDCWPFTGHCVYFDSVGCNKWESECFSCPQSNTYPKSFYDNSRSNYQLKKQLYSNSKNLTIVTVSDWLSENVKRSFLSKHRIETIYNGVDIHAFNPIKSSELESIGNNQFVILGVASPWTERKGLVDFISLRSRLCRNSFLLILIGLNSQQIRALPKGILGVKKTNSTQELADYYSRADVYLNMTYEDNFPTTNIEALACGTPVITYSTGGSPEAVCDLTGFVVPKGDISGVVEKIEFIKLMGKEKFANECRKRAVEQFNGNENYAKYIEIYKSLI